MIILNEKEYVDDILRGKKTEPANIYIFLNTYARYLYHEKNLRRTGIMKELDYFMAETIPNYHPADWNNRFEAYAKRAGAYPLCNCGGVWITKNEIRTIRDIHDKVLERLAFTLLCLAKYGNFKNPDNNSWVSYRNGEIFSMACINTTSVEKDIKIGRLNDLGLIQYAKKVNNLNIRVTYAEEHGTKELFVSDFRKLGNEWRLYSGEDYIRCSTCGILVKKKKGTSKYCCACRKKSDAEKNRLRVAKHRRKCNASEILS